jgi:hypothetical protein
VSSAAAILTNCRLAIRFRFAPASEMSAVLRKVLCGAAIGPISKSAAEAGRVVVTATSVSAPASAPLSRRFDLNMILAFTRTSVAQEHFWYKDTCDGVLLNSNMVQALRQ